MSLPRGPDLLGRHQEAGAREAGEEEGEEVRHLPNPEWLSVVDVCWKCGSADLMERDDELGFQGNGRHGVRAVRGGLRPGDRGHPRRRCRLADDCLAELELDCTSIASAGRRHRERAGARVSDRRRPGEAPAPRLGHLRSMADSAGYEAHRAGHLGEARTSRLPGRCTQSSWV
jgi:hypothetical protein